MYHWCFYMAQDDGISKTLASLADMELRFTDNQQSTTKSLLCDSTAPDHDPLSTGDSSQPCKEAVLAVDIPSLDSLVGASNLHSLRVNGSIVSSCAVKASFEAFLDDLPP
ncbi:unnamed protein product [Cuscuta campestris]|uniref:Uncharacterized protein n=1 Tax=Cuscuta campestris TaxID=132261 RepID=A0A484NH67_9ASTE|nr:unnamed protein product [Cuscuta campestris]